MAFDLSGLRIKVKFEGRDLGNLIDILRKLEKEAGHEDVKNALGSNYGNTLRIMGEAEAELREINSGRPKSVTKEISELQKLNELFYHLLDIMVVRKNAYFENMRIFYNQVLKLLAYFEKMLTEACKEEQVFLSNLFRLRTQMHEMLDRYNA